MDIGSIYLLLCLDGGRDHWNPGVKVGLTVGLTKVCVNDGMDGMGVLVTRK